MLHLNVHLTVKDEADIPQIKTWLFEQGRLSRQEPGCVRFEVYQSEVDPKVFFLNEYWTTAEALEAHRKAHAYLTIYQPNVIPRVERAGHKCTLLR